MDELTQYLKSNADYTEFELEQILNKKIIITDDHIKNIKFEYCNFNIIVLFEKYGYVFTNEIYKMIIQKYGYALFFISEDKKTDEIYEIAIKQNGMALQYIIDDKKTNKICEIAVQQHGYALCYVPEDKKTDELC